MMPVPQRLSVTSPYSLDFRAGLLVILELFLTAGVAASSYGYPYYRKGKYLNHQTHLLAWSLSLLLLACIVANCLLMRLRLVVPPEYLGNKDEMAVTGAALGVLWSTDILSLRLTVRAVATMLTLIPTFRFGPA